MINRGRIKTTTFVSFLFFVICLFSLSGIKGYANYIAAFCLAVVFLVCFTTYGTRISLKSDVVLIGFFILFYVLTSVPFLDAKYCATYTTAYLISFSPVLIYHISSKYWENNDQQRLIKWLSIAWLIISVISMFFYFSNPMAARELARDGDAFAGKIVGGYTLSYGSALIAVYVLGVIVGRKPRRKIRIGLIFLYVLLTVLIFITQSTLTTFALVFGSCMTLLTIRKTTGLNKVIKVSLISILLFAFIVVSYIEISDNVFFILNWLSNRNDTLIYKRMRELVNSYFLGENSRHYNERTGLITDSVKLFFQSPIIGHGYRYGNVFEAGKVYGIGNHSEFFDCLARYGLVGSLPLFIVYFRSFRRIEYNKFGLLCTFIPLVLFNPFISFASNLAILLILPLTDSILCSEEKSPNTQPIKWIGLNR